MWWHSWQSLSTLFLSSMHLFMNPHIHLHMHAYKHIQYTRRGVVSMQEMLFKWPCLHMTLNDPHTPELYPSETGSSLWSVCELNGGHSLVYSELLAPELVASLLWDSRLQYLVQKETFFFKKQKQADTSYRLYRSNNDQYYTIKTLDSMYFYYWKKKFLFLWPCIGQNKG